MMRMDAGSLFLSLLFGAIGLVALRRGKKEGNIPCAFLGLGLMVYPYLVSGWLMTMVVGAVLTASVWYAWDWE